MNKLITDIGNSIEAATRFVKGYIISIGSVTNIFSAIENNIQTVDDIAEEYGYRNKRLLKLYLDILCSYSILKKENSKYFLVDGVNIRLEKRDFMLDKMKEDLISFFMSLINVFPHLLIDPNNPLATTDFERDANIWSIWLENDWFKSVRWAITEIGRIGKRDYILDMGSGSVSPLYFAEIVGENGRVTGLDKSKKMVEIARTKIENRGYSWVEIEHCDIENDVGLDEEYDIVILSMVLEYVHNMEKVIENAYNALKDGGRLIIFKMPDNPIINFTEALIPQFVKLRTTREIKEVLTKVIVKEYGDLLIVAHKY
ncbi:MAG: hypothetical protein DRN91_00775 [Candidatus Alkanophagales archaeon]|nr:MAG: hypothetical protein DRN91_00775 [Candidatus Alkanophagales archaeon]